MNIDHFTRIAITLPVSKPQESVLCVRLELMRNKKSAVQAQAHVTLLVVSIDGRPDTVAQIFQTRGPDLRIMFHTFVTHPNEKPRFVDDGYAMMGTKEPYQFARKYSLQNGSSTGDRITDFCRAFHDWYQGLLGVHWDGGRAPVQGPWIGLTGTTSKGAPYLYCVSQFLFGKGVISPHISCIGVPHGGICDDIKAQLNKCATVTEYKDVLETVVSRVDGPGRINLRDHLGELAVSGTNPTTGRKDMAVAL